MSILKPKSRTKAVQLFSRYFLILTLCVAFISGIAGFFSGPAHAAPGKFMGMTDEQIAKYRAEQKRRRASQKALSGTQATPSPTPSVQPSSTTKVAQPTPVQPSRYDSFTGPVPVKPEESFYDYDPKRQATSEEQTKKDEDARLAQQAIYAQKAAKKAKGQKNGWVTVSGWNSIASQTEERKAQCEPRERNRQQQEVDRLEALKAEQDKKDQEARLANQKKIQKLAEQRNVRKYKMSQHGLAVQKSLAASKAEDLEKKSTVTLPPKKLIKFMGMSDEQIAEYKAELKKQRENAQLNGITYKSEGSGSEDSGSEDNQPPQQTLPAVVQQPSTALPKPESVHGPVPALPDLSFFDYDPVRRKQEQLEQKNNGTTPFSGTVDKTVSDQENQGLVQKAARKAKNQKDGWETLQNWKSISRKQVELQNELKAQREARELKKQQQEAKRVAQKAHDDKKAKDQKDGWETLQKWKSISRKQVELQNELKAQREARELKKQQQEAKRVAQKAHDDKKAKDQKDGRETLQNWKSLSQKQVELQNELKAQREARELKKQQQEAKRVAQKAHDDKKAKGQKDGWETLQNWKSISQKQVELQNELKAQREARELKKQQQETDRLAAEKSKKDKEVRLANQKKIQKLADQRNARRQKIVKHDRDVQNSLDSIKSEEHKKNNKPTVWVVPRPHNETTDDLIGDESVVLPGNIIVSEIVHSATKTADAAGGVDLDSGKSVETQEPVQEIAHSATNRHDENKVEVVVSEETRTDTALVVIGAEQKDEDKVEGVILESKPTEEKSTEHTSSETVDLRDASEDVELAQVVYDSGMVADLAGTAIEGRNQSAVALFSGHHRMMQGFRNGYGVGIRSSLQRVDAGAVEEEVKQGLGSASALEIGAAYNYMRIYGGRGTAKAGKGLSGFSQNSFGFEAGLFRVVNTELMVGLMLGAESAKTSLKGSSGSTERTSVRIGPFVSWQRGNFHIDGALTVGRHDMRAKGRDTVSNTVMKGNYSMNEWAASLNVGYDIHFDDVPGLTLTPMAEFLYMDTRTPGYSLKSGSGEHVKVKGGSRHDRIDRFGMMLNYQVPGANTEVYGGAGIQRNHFGSNSTTMAHSNDGVSVTERRKQRDRSLQWYTLGVTSQLDEARSLSLSLEGTHGSNSSSYGLSASYTYRFK